MDDCSQTLSSEQVKSVMGVGAFGWFFSPRVWELSVLMGVCFAVPTMECSADTVAPGPWKILKATS